MEFMCSVERDDSLDDKKSLFTRMQTFQVSDRETKFVRKRTGDTRAPYKKSNRSFNRDKKQMKKIKEERVNVYGNDEK